MCLLVMNRPTQVCEEIVNTIENSKSFPCIRVALSIVTIYHETILSIGHCDGDSVDTDLTSNFP